MSLEIKLPEPARPASAAPSPQTPVAEVADTKSPKAIAWSVVVLLLIVGAMWFTFFGGKSARSSQAAPPRPPSETIASAPKNTKDAIARADELQRSGKPESAAAILQTYLNTH